MIINFCTQCGGTVSVKALADEHIDRHSCDSCGFVHYLNPKITAACVVYEGEKVLLCKRNIEPKKGLWTIPGGFMENGETSKRAAERETQEETNAVVSAHQLFVVANIPQANFVHLVYLAKLNNASYSATPESLEVKLYNESEVPWDDIAFHTARVSLQHFFQDQKNNQFKIHEVNFE